MYPRMPNAQEDCVCVGGGEYRAFVGAKGVGGWEKVSTVRNDSQRNYSDFVFNFCHLKQTVLLSQVKAIER